MGVAFIMVGIVIIYLTLTNKIRPLFAALFDLNPATK